MLIMDLENQYCPICSVKVKFNPRYPKYICNHCHNKAEDKNGRKLLFRNEDFSGGFKAIYEDTEEEYNSNTCFVEGIECYAEEAKFGGIVIQIR